MLSIKPVLPKLLKAFSIVSLSVLINTAAAFAQTDPKTEIRNIIESVNLFTGTLLPEKVYLHTDRSSYAIGDTIWFKAYLFDAASLSAPGKSGVLYVEMANEQNEVVKRFMVSLFLGMGWGNIAIPEKEMPQGYYTIRAYTNWMRNFDESCVFKKQLYIGTPAGQDMMISSKFEVKQDGDKQHANISLLLSKIDQKQLVGYKDFALKITEGNKVWYRDKVETTIEGGLDFNFNIPEKAASNKLAIILQDVKSPENNPQYKIPLLLNRPEKTDLQFMPEGGSMVEGLDTHIAFKALTEDGNSTDVSGTVYNSKQEQVTTFQSAHQGMGVFNLHAQPGETYTAKIKFPNGEYSKPYNLPPVKHSGIVLNVDNDLKSDSLQIRISSTADLQVGGVYYLVAQARGVGCYGSVVRLNEPLKKIAINKDAFPTGVVRFTLLNQDRQPLNERIVYIDHDDNLRVNVATNKTVYTKRDSVALDITVADKTGKPINGTFSVSVTDDGQVKNDSLGTTLKSYLWLTSDLKGYIENPGYYFQKPLTEVMARQLDNLLLTQGWVNYDWSVVFKPLKPAQYNAEQSFGIKGKVTNVFNKPIANSGVVMVAKHPTVVLDTVTDNTGTFNFSHLFPADSAAYVVQARNKRGKSFNVGITVDEFTPPIFNPSNRTIIPWYVNIDTLRLNALKAHINYKSEQDKAMGIHMLNEVAIVDKKVVKDSKNLNGEGESDFALSMADLQLAGKITLGDLLRQRVKNFHQGFGKRPYDYFINTQLVHLIIDGVDIKFYYPPGSGPYSDYVKQYMDSYTAEDIKGIEVMSSMKYVSPYSQTFLNPMSIPSDHAFIEITTYAGKGPMLNKTPGVYLYRPLVFAVVKQFYSPRYSSKTNDTGIDARSTIYWAPSIITDANGRASINFYTADKPGTYTVMIEGSDMAGNIESTQSKIVVK